jgi:hypothetical protein
VRDLTAEEAREFAAACYRDPVLFCREFLSHLFPSPIPWFHRALLSVLTGRTAFLHKYGELDKIISNFVYETPQGPKPLFGLGPDGVVELYWRKYLQIMMPRSFSKTTIAGIAMTLYDIVYENFKVGVYVSETSSQAEMQLDNVKRELSENPKFIQIFGDLKPEIRDAEKWNAKVFETTRGIALYARGSGSQIRGLNHRGVRPQKIIVDDVEDRESVKTELQRRKTRQWFYGDLMPALQTIGDGQIVALGTLLHPDALLRRLQDDEQWSVVKLTIRARDGSYLWPQAIDEKKEAQLKRSYARVGELPTFYLEYYNEARAEETSGFRQSNFRYGRPAPEEVIVATSTYMDPAISKNQTADQCVIVTVRQNNKGWIYVSAGWGKRGATVDEMLDEYFRQHNLFKSRFNGVESNAFQAALVHEIRKQMFARRTYFEVTPVHNARRKSERIRGVLQARFASHYIFFEESLPELETQLLDYDPDRDQHDDWPDALAGAIQLLDPVASYNNLEMAKDEDAIPELLEEIGGSADFAS